VGMKVIIPFGKGNREIEGYVTDISDTPSFDVTKMKKIIKIVEGQVNFEERLLRLASWIRDTTGSNLNDAIKVVLPVKTEVKAIEVKEVIITGDEESILNNLVIAKKRGYSEQIKFLQLFEKKIQSGTLKVSYEEIKSINKNPSQTIKSLEKKGIITLQKRTVNRNPYEGILGDLTALENAPKEEINLNSEQELLVDEISGYAEKLFSLGDGMKLKEEEKLNPDGQTEKIENKPILLHGITGSGKTVVYIEIIKNIVKAGKQAIVLIPEISLTYQTLKRFYEAFGDRCSCLHSKLSSGERFDQFKRVKEGEIDVMIGPRSALFTPFNNLGIIIIDEEHENTYQNEYPPKYHARNVACHMAKEENAVLLLGSATPSVESFYKAQIGEYKLYKLTKRAVEHATLPNIYVTDLREELRRHNRSIFGAKLYELIKDRLQKKEQIMLFINRRGFSGSVSCRECGEVIQCKNCSVAMKAHVQNGKLSFLKCHYCGYEEPYPSVCPVCGSKYIGTFGTGTQKVEKMVHDTFPEARVLRMDRDTTQNKGGHDEILRAFANEEADILIGTQMIVKGHDFPKVTLVGILAADMSLNVNSYEAYERTFELLVQASGRAGRADIPGDVVIQTYNPENYAIVAAVKSDYEMMYREEINRRKSLHYPPVSHILEVLCLCTKEDELLSFCNKAARRLKVYGDDFTILGPVEDDIYKIDNVYRYKIYIKSPDQESLIDMIKLINKMKNEDVTFKNVILQSKVT
nr:primosomal protein N' [Lachnospiraceae bacterium]